MPKQFPTGCVDSAKRLGRSFGVSPWSDLRIDPEGCAQSRMARLAVSHGADPEARLTRHPEPSARVRYPSLRARAETARLL